MNREGLQESLSALMDNEADELELRRVVAASEDASLRATWGRYHMARAAMHKELRDPQLNLVASVSAVLDDEKEPGHARRSWRVLGQMAVAATVTVAVLAGVRFYTEHNEAQLAKREPSSIQEGSAPASAILTSYSQEEAGVPQTMEHAESGQQEAVQ